MIKHFLNPPNWFTAASIFCSVYAVSLVVGGDTPARTMAQACILVIFAGLFDLLDGRVARLTKSFSDFGVQLDSLADLISFGLAPALIAYTWSLHELGIAHWLWGRAPFPDGDLVHYVLWPEGGGDPEAMLLHIGRDGRTPRPERRRHRPPR